MSNAEKAKKIKELLKLAEITDRGMYIDPIILRQIQRLRKQK